MILRTFPLAVSLSYTIGYHFKLSKVCFECFSSCKKKVGVFLLFAKHRGFCCSPLSSLLLCANIVAQMVLDAFLRAKEMV